MTTRQKQWHYQTGLERHVQTVIQFVLVALLLWSGQSTLDIKDKVARLEEQFRAMSKDVNTVASDRYTASQAMRDLENVDKKIANIEKSNAAQDEWIRSMRDRVISLEQDFRASSAQRRSQQGLP